MLLLAHRARRLPAPTLRLGSFLLGSFLLASLLPSQLPAEDRLPANQWRLLHQESNEGGKRFARALLAEPVGRLYLWGTGGAQPARNVYQRYELETITVADLLPPRARGAAAWTPAFPEERAGVWTAEDYPPFRILGQSGPDGLKYDEGPRLQTVGGYHATNRVQWWDFDGVARPSPIHTFNMACWDSRRGRLLYYGDGRVFTLNPANHRWTDLETPNHPVTCRKVAWGNLAYDGGRDRVMLFGGGLATNPLGGAPTWFYDCVENRWSRPELEREPPLRCNAALAYDPATGITLLFGGYNQAAALNDTWVFHGEENRWEQRTPRVAPPPMEQPAFAVLPEGRVLVVGNDARQVRREHRAASSAAKQSWIYHLAADAWTPLEAELELPGYDWLTAEYSAAHDCVLLTAFGPERRLYALRYDPAAPAAAEPLPGAPPGTIAWKYPEQKLSLEQAEPADPAEREEFLASLPANRFVNAEPPGLLISKTWSTAVLDTDRSEVLYTGGGHSGYSGNDIARYSLLENRWTQDQPPRFPPYLEGTNAGIYGWSHGMIPFSQHTYLWYAYDPQSKTLVYLARPSIVDGDEVQLTADPASTFTYHAAEHGHASWVYDPAERKMHPPSFGRPFRNPWHLSVIGTPEGLYCAVDGELHHGRVSREEGRVAWRRIDRDFPQPREEIKYHYEYQPLVHDTRRNRLVQLKGDGGRVDLFARPLGEEGAWRQLEVTGKGGIGREAVYLPKHDRILWLGDRLYSLDCSTNHMAEVAVELPAGLYGHECAMVYDPRHDLCVALIPKSFSGPMQTFLYRFDPRTARFQ